MHGSAIRVCRSEPLCTCGVLVERIHWGSQSTIMNEAHLKDKHLTADANDRYIITYQPFPFAWDRLHHDTELMQNILMIVNFAKFYTEKD